jgi:hypothetical protein
MQIEFPEAKEIIKRLDAIEKLLQTQTREPEHKADRTEEWLMGPEIRHALRCGPKRIKQLVEEGKLKKSMAFGRHPRYKWVNENKTG